MRKKLLVSRPLRLLAEIPQNYIISQCPNAPTHDDDNFHEKGDS
jgi:hypothetical protein